MIHIPRLLTALHAAEDMTKALDIRLAAVGWRSVVGLWNGSTLH